jgi:hypothetical protein
VIRVLDKESQPIRRLQAALRVPRGRSARNPFIGFKKIYFRGSDLWVKASR